jgi:ATP-binding cassette subfamily B protein
MSESTSFSPPETKGGWYERAADMLDVMSGTPRICKLIWNANRKLCSGVLLLNLTLALIPLLEMELTKAILDAITRSGGSPVGASWTLMLMGAGTALTFLYFAVEPSMWVCQEALADILTRDITVLLLHKANSLVDIALFETPEFYDKLETAQREAGHKPLNVMNDLCGLVRSIVASISMLFLLLSYQPLIPLAIVLLSLPKMIEEVRHRKVGWAICNYEVPEVRKMGYYKSVLTHDSSAKEIRLFDLGEFFLGRYVSCFNEFFERHNKLRRDHWRNNLVLSSLSAIGTAGAFIFVALAALAQVITVGSYTLYVAAIDRLRYGLQGVLHCLSGLYEANLFAKNLFDFLEIHPTMELVPPEFAQNVPASKACSIEFRNVAFAYPKAEKAVFNDLSFSIEAGQTVALVGQNGAGKTTIVKLLSRLYDPTVGKILIDGVDLREYDLNQWRANTSVILQDYSRYYLSAKENVGLGRTELMDDMNAIRTAVERGGAGDLIEGMPDKYETILGRIFSPEKEKGTELSGGEWQKMALSRAFMRSLEEAGVDRGIADAQLLILDEPTAALDAQAEYDVYTRFTELTKGKTTFLISHRFSTVRMANLILVMQDGKITEQGGHDELMERNGEYARLFNMQADRYK